LAIIRADEKIEGSVELANPNLDCSGVKIQSAFFVDLGCGIRRRQNLDADFGCASGQDFGPPNEVKRSLRLDVWKFDGDGHKEKLGQK
jgi:hypothetical protein